MSYMGCHSEPDLKTESVIIGNASADFDFEFRIDPKAR